MNKLVLAAGLCMLAAPAAAIAQTAENNFEAFEAVLDPQVEVACRASAVIPGENKIWTGRYNACIDANSVNRSSSEIMWPQVPVAERAKCLHTRVPRDRTMAASWYGYMELCLRSWVNLHPQEHHLSPVYAEPSTPQGATQGQIQAQIRQACHDAVAQQRLYNFSHSSMPGTDQSSEASGRTMHEYDVCGG